MAYYDENPNWALDAVNDALKLASTDEASNLNIQKKAEDITVNPLMLLGGIAGTALMGSAMAAKKEEEYKQQYGNAVARILNEQNKKLTDMGSNYYSSIENIDKDLKIMFTPFSVAYMLRGTVIDTVSIDNMPEAMKNAWRNKDSQYFKNVLVNKVYMDAQQSEQMFIKRLIEYDKSMKNQMKKKADTDEATDYCLFELMDKVAYFNNVFKASSKSPVIDKYAASLAENLLSQESEGVTIEIGAAKMAEDTDLDLGIRKLAFLFFGKKDDVNVLTVDAIKKDLNISYLPDRVLFVSHEMVVSQLNSYEMNEEAYAHFSKKDDDYFRKLFFNMAKQAGYEVEIEKTAAEEFPMQAEEPEKVAVAIDQEAVIGDLFTADNVHPKVYYLFMMKNFGERWLEWDMDTIESMLQDNLGIDTLGETAMNKIMCISLVLNSDAAFTGYHTFEKVVRAFNNRDIDFDERESNLSLGEFVNAMHIMTDLISDTDDNLYDNFSDHVFGYLTEVLMTGNVRVCVQRTSSKMEEAFWKLVNRELLDLWNQQLPYGLFGVQTATDTGAALKLQARAESSSIQKIAISVAEKFRDKIDLAAMREDINRLCVSNGMENPAHVEIVLANVLGGLAVDKFVPYMDNRRDEQIKKYL